MEISLKLGDVETTALIPVAIKASESLRKNARVYDDVAVKMVQSLAIDTKAYDKFMSHEGVIARTVMLDRMVQTFVKEHPDAVVVNMAAGFDNRFKRVDNGRITWFDLDLPDTIILRKKVFEERDRVTMIAGDVLNDDWCATVRKAVEAKNSEMLFLAEGLLMYLTLEEIGTMLHILKKNFPNGTLFAEQNSPLLVKNQKYHDTVKNTKAVFRSGTKKASELCALCEGIKCVEEHSFNEEMKKHSIRGKLFAFLFPSLNDRWATFVW